MGRPTDANTFLAALAELNGRSSNAALQDVLKWSDDKYWQVHSKLYQTGSIEKGRGYSGTVILVPTSIEKTLGIVEHNTRSIEIAVQSPVEAEHIDEPIKESDLYAPVLDELSKRWNNHRNLDQIHVDNIAAQGSKFTGGSWSRPDMAIVALKKFEYLPNSIFEIHTFEVKPSYDVTVKGVMEALSHREFSTRSYVIYYTAGRELADYPESSRIEALAAKHGIGVFAAKKIDDFDSWIEIVVAERVNPDPEEMELFIKRSLSDNAKSKILKWMR